MILKREDVPQEVIQEQMGEVFGVRVLHMALVHEMDVDGFLAQQLYIESYHPMTGLKRGYRSAARREIAMAAYQVWRVHFVVTHAMGGGDNE